MVFTRLNLTNSTGIVTQLSNFLFHIVIHYPTLTFKLAASGIPTRLPILFRFDIAN